MAGNPNRAKPTAGRSGQDQTDRADRAEQRRVEAQALQERLAEQVDQLVDSDRWRAFLDFTRSFHSYSLNNVLLIQAQHPSATAVAGYRAWQSKGRQVRRGEQAIKIWGYSRKTITDEDPDTGEEVTRTVARFPVLKVFALDQTDPIDEADDPTDIAPRLIGGDPAGIYDRVTAALAQRGWQMTREPIPGERNGYTTTDGSRHVVVDAGLSDAQAAKTALHEAAHVVLHAETLTPAEYQTHRGIAEIEAESAAYVLAGMAGLDTSDYSVGYIATWADGDPDRVRTAATNVLTAVGDLAPPLGLTPEPDTDADTTGTDADRDARTAKVGDAASEAAVLSDQAPPPAHHAYGAGRDPNHHVDVAAAVDHAGPADQVEGEPVKQADRMAGPQSPALVSSAPAAGGLRDAAVAVAERGWHVFPLAPGEKRPAVKAWEDRATTDLERIHRCWTPTDTNHGQWNIGIATGPSGLLVVDLDTPDSDSPDGFNDSGQAVLDRLVAEHGETLPATYAVATPSGGRHLYYTAPTPGEGEHGDRLGNSSGRLGPKIDTRGVGGFVVAAGSRTGDGRTYVAEDDGHPVADLPGWMAEQLAGDPAVEVPGLPVDDRRRAAYVEGAVRHEVARVLAAPPGQHNHALYVASAHLGELVAGGHLDGPTVRAALIAARESVGQPERGEARATVDSGLRSGAQRPRTIGDTDTDSNRADRATDGAARQEVTEAPPRGQVPRQPSPPGRARQTVSAAREQTEPETVAHIWNPDGTCTLHPGCPSNHHRDNHGRADNDPGHGDDDSGDGDGGADLGAAGEDRGSDPGEVAATSTVRLGAATAERVARSATRRPSTPMGEPDVERRNYIEAGARGLHAVEQSTNDGQDGPGEATLAQLGQLSGGGWLHPSTVYTATCHCCVPGTSRDDCTNQHHATDSEPDHTGEPNHVHPEQAEQRKPPREPAVQEPGAQPVVEPARTAPAAAADTGAAADDGGDAATASEGSAAPVERAKLAAAEFGARLRASEQKWRAQGRAYISPPPDRPTDSRGQTRGESLA